jgi:membrane dipeptidase
MQIDLHADTPMWMDWFGYRFLKRHRAFFPRGAWMSHVDLPRMIEGEQDAQVFGLVALPIDVDPIGSIQSLVDRVYAAAFQSDGRFCVVRTAAELFEVRARGARACFLSLEGVHPLRGRVERADGLIERGVVSFGIAHLHANEACRPLFGLGRDDSQGLTQFGRDIVDHLRGRGALVDLTHLNRKAFFEVVERAKDGVFVSHTGVNGAYTHWRNMDDDQIRAVADAGGVIGVIFSRGFLGGVDLDAVVRHVEHIIDVGGEQTPALGSDWDGMVVPVRGLQDVAGLPALRRALGAAGLSSAAVDGVMGENALRMIRETLG